MDWALHLYADVKHDFGEKTEGFYNRIEGEQPVQQYVTLDGNKEPGERMETRIRRYFFDEVIGVPPDTTRAQMVRNPIIFEHLPETATYKKQLFPTLIPGGRVAIGHDAGAPITRNLGAEHFINVGNVLDQATTSYGRDYDPIWFEFDDEHKRQRFNLLEYGFNGGWPGASEIAIEQVPVVRGPNGNPEFKVKIAIQFGDGELRDAVSKQVIANMDEITGLKKLNDTDPKTAGYFISPEQTPKNNEPETIRHQIGKTTGDLVQVASLLIDYATAPGRWKRFNFDYNPAAAGPAAAGAGPGEILDLEADRIPNIFVLKTNDNLNHVRAVAKNLSSILELFNPDKNLKKYSFIPTTAADSSAERYYEFAYQKLTLDFDSNFNQTIGELTRLITGTPLQKPDDIRNGRHIEFPRSKRGAPDSTFASAENFTAFAANIRRAIERIRLLQEVLRRETVRVRGLQQNDFESIQTYNNALNYIQVRTPKTTKIFQNTGRVVPQVDVVSQSEDVKGALIPIRDMIRSPDDFERLFMTPINEIIAEVEGKIGPEAAAAAAAAAGIVPAAPAAPEADGAAAAAAPEAPAAPEADGAAAAAAPEAPAPAPAPAQPDVPVQEFKRRRKGGSQRGGAVYDVVVTVTDEIQINWRISQLQTLSQYKKYSNNPSIKEFLENLYNLVRHMNSQAIEDMVVLGRIYEEIGLVDETEKDKSYTVVGSTQPIPDEITAITDKFNAFTYWLQETCLPDVEGGISKPYYASKRMEYEAAVQPVDEMADGAAGPPRAPGAAGVLAAAAAEAAAVSPPRERGSPVPPATPPDQVRVAAQTGSPGSAAPSAASTLLASPAGSQPSGISRVGSMMFSPMSPPDSAPRSDESARQSESSGEEGKQGGLRRTYRKQRNARNSTSRVSRNAKHSGLRKRKGTRRSRRV